MGAYAPELAGPGTVGHSHADVEQLIDGVIPIYLATRREDRELRPWLCRPEDLPPGMAAIFARIAAARSAMLPAHMGARVCRRGYGQARPSGTRQRWGS